MGDMLDGRAALVTGARRGIGKGIALELACAGCRVAVNYVTEPAEAEETAAEIRSGQTIWVDGGLFSQPPWVQQHAR
jgi:3-oxoacyl-[acyl-carrier protein] reductase